MEMENNTKKNKLIVFSFVSKWYKLLPDPILYKVTIQSNSVIEDDS